MQIEYVDINSIKPYQNNPRHNEEAIPYVMNSIREFGFKNPIIIDKNNVIIAGHTRLESAKRLGMKEVPIIHADDLTEEQVKAFRLADNKVSEKAEWDFNMLDAELADLDIDMSEFGFENINVDDYGTDFSLPDGDKEPFMQITFTLSNEQAEEIKEKINEIKKDKSTMSKYNNYGNDNANGNALYTIIKEWEKQKI